jgi:hypothetical protein
MQNIIFIFTLTLFLLPKPTQACTYSPEYSDLKYWSSLLSLNEQVFIGQLNGVSVEKDQLGKVKASFYHFTPFKVYKGTVSSRDKFILPSYISENYFLHTTSKSFKELVGGYYFIFANRGKPLRFDSFCNEESKYLGRLSIDELNTYIDLHRARLAIDSGVLEELEWAKSYLKNQYAKKSGLKTHFYVDLAEQIALLDEAINVYMSGYSKTIKKSR